MMRLLEGLKQSDSIYMPISARISAVQQLTEMETLFTIAMPHEYRLRHKPGQFVQLSILGVGEAPISISSSPSRSNSAFELCVRKAGDLTNALHRKKPGDLVGIRGPFGRGFPLDHFQGKDILFVAGGLGMAPLRSLINEILDLRGNYGRVIILYGARSPKDLLFQTELIEWAARSDVELHLTVDNPDSQWENSVGVITTLFKEVEIFRRNTAAVVVGPPIMYKFVIQELLNIRIPKGNIWLSFERRMKCGVGKCGHCQMNHLYTCQAGPTYSYAEIEGLPEALG
ncbi:MAG: FAD/NAD(P)-binding protein [Anaerolineales bacterium]|nr:FAD/NAD(P)-binding protein [Anaerolineales bacterium]